MPRSTVQPAGQAAYLGAQRRRTHVAVPSSMRSVELAPKQGFPQRITVNLPYQKRLNSTSAASLTDYVFALTNLNDVDTTGGAAQPRAYDQWTAAYDFYRVNWVKIQLDIRQRANHGLAVYLLPSATSTSVTDSRPFEIQMSQNIGIVSANQPPLHVSRTFFPGRVLGMSPTEYQSSDETAGAVGGAPAQVAYLHLLMQNIDNTTLVDCEWDVKLLYNVTFYDRADLAVS